MDLPAQMSRAVHSDNHFNRDKDEWGYKLIAFVINTEYETGSNLICCSFFSSVKVIPLAFISPVELY
jgi:hypothetical protein